jgi:hypothetical protein
MAGRNVRTSTLSWSTFHSEGDDVKKKAPDLYAYLLEKQDANT